MESCLTYGRRKALVDAVPRCANRKEIMLDPGLYQKKVRPSYFPVKLGRWERDFKFFDFPARSLGFSNARSDQNRQQQATATATQ